MKFINPDDLRFNSLKKGFNLRWPAIDQDASKILICENEQDVIDSIKYSINNNQRVTVRSGGHCYEGFVSNNKGGNIIDVGLLNSYSYDSEKGYRLGCGIQNWEGALKLYKSFNLTLPGGSCYSVALGGHISGGGFGWLSRLHGLTVDWLTGVDIITVDFAGAVSLQYVDENSNPDLFYACRGAGGGNFGIITSYYFKNLPVPPQKVVFSTLAFNWSDIDKNKFFEIINVFSNYWSTEGLNPNTFGMCSILKPTHISSGQFLLRTQFCNVDGSIDDTTILEDYISRFSSFNPTIQTTYQPHDSLPQINSNGNGNKALANLPGNTQVIDWINNVQNLNGSGPVQRGKYKSANMKANFTSYEIEIIWKYLTLDPTNTKLKQSLLQIDSYGGKINNINLADITAVPQRSSVMKLQFQTYWTNEADDKLNIDWINSFYQEMYSNSNVPVNAQGTPYPGEYYEGCYINYPDVEMKKFPFWFELYYPGIYSRLLQIKNDSDPLNIFNHELSIGS